jgi:hypothetical protein
MGMIGIINRVGGTFSNLSVKYFNGFDNAGHQLWICKCTCGNYISVSGTNLTTGHTGSCGCLTNEWIGNKNSTHRMTKTPFYKIWAGMKQRCLDPNCDHYKDYGGRGIKVCERWMDFNNFYDDKYESYLEHGKIHGFGYNTTIERIDVYGNYEPENVKWATWDEQAKNKRYSIITEDRILYDFKKREHSNLLHHAIKCTMTPKNIILFEHYLGCTVEEFKQHIESQFEPWMNWNNNGRPNKNRATWSFDHIIPCFTFDLSKEEDCLKCFNYKNIRPRESHRNYSERNYTVKIK